MWFRGFALQILKKLNFNRVPWLTRSRHMILGVWYLKIRKNIENMLWNHGYYDSWLVSMILSRVRLRVKIMVARSNVCRQKVWIVARNAKTSRVYPELKKTVAKRDRSRKVDGCFEKIKLLLSLGLGINIKQLVEGRLFPRSSYLDVYIYIFQINNAIIFLNQPLKRSCVSWFSQVR